MAVRIQHRRDSTADWQAADPTLAEGEIGLDNDLRRIKVGDGSSAWSVLPYFGAYGYSTLIGDGAATDITVTHGLDADCIVWQLRDAGTGEKVEAAEYYIGANVTQLVFDDPPETDSIHFSAIGFPA